MQVHLIIRQTQDIGFSLLNHKRIKQEAHKSQEKDVGAWMRLTNTSRKSSKYFTHYCFFLSKVICIYFSVKVYGLCLILSDSPCYLILKVPRNKRNVNCRKNVRCASIHILVLSISKGPATDLQSLYARASPLWNKKT